VSREVQVLVTLQSPEAGGAQSDYAKAQAELTSQRAQATVREERPRPRRTPARAQGDPAAGLRAGGRRRRARAERGRSGEAELSRARSSAEQLGAIGSANGEIALKTPLAGVVLARTAVPGTVVEGRRAARRRD
jgi:hypothetical protein